MPVAAFAVSGCGRAVSSWLNLVERLGFGPDDQLAPAWHPSQRPGAGGARSPPRTRQRLRLGEPDGGAGRDG
jgi:hypothetical protein